MRLVLLIEVVKGPSSQCHIESLNDLCLNTDGGGWQVLGQGWWILSCKEPDSESFRLCDLCLSHSLRLGGELFVCNPLKMWKPVFVWEPHKMGCRPSLSSSGLKETVYVCDILQDFHGNPNRHFHRLLLSWIYNQISWVTPSASRPSWCSLCAGLEVSNRHSISWSSNGSAQFQPSSLS